LKMSNEDRIKFDILTKLFEIWEMKPLSQAEYLQSYSRFDINPPRLFKMEAELMVGWLEKYIEAFGQPVKIDDDSNGYIWFNEIK
jgi:hypothetical protein